MRLKLVFELEKPELDIQYRKSIISWIKYSLEEYDKNLFEELYGQGKIKKKTFTWSTILNKPEFKGDNVILNGTGFYIIFSAYNYAYRFTLV